MPLLLKREDVQRVLTMADAISAVEDGLKGLARDRVIMPQRTAIRMQDHHGLHLGMPAYVDTGSGPGALALKVVTVYPDNPDRYGLPTTIGTLLLNDPRTGELLAIMDAGYLTAVRTGAISGVATKHLARSDARSLGIFGAGAMARTQLLAIREVRDLENVLVFDPAGDMRERFAAEMSQVTGIEIKPAEDARACAGCDIVVTATSSREPVFDGSWLRPGAHVNGIGSHSPDAREIDTVAVQRCKIVVDHRPACMAEAGEFIITMREGLFGEERIHASLGEIAAGMRPGRESPEEITLFKSVGFAMEDAVTARLAYERALAMGVGQTIDF